MRGRGERGEGHLDQVEETSSEGRGWKWGGDFVDHIAMRKV